jgi:hypothetical protein
MSNLGIGLSAGITAPLTLFGKGAFQAAVDAQEMESAFDVVFGNMSADVRAWAEETGNALGRSTQEVQRGALAFQNLFGKSLDPAQATEMSKQFAVLTQDLASFKNLSNEVAQQKLFSGLVGEAEPLRAVGVFLSETAVKNKAAQMGLNGALSDQEKIVIRAAIIQEQLAQASGDVLRTSASAANQIKASNAAYEELQITIGTKLIPAITPLVTMLGEALNWFSSLPEPVQTATVVIAGLAAALGPVLLTISGIISIAPAVATAFGVIKAAMLGLLANPVLLGAAAVITGVYLAWQNWDKIKGLVASVGDSVSQFWNNTATPFFSSIGDSLANGAMAWSDWAEGAVRSFINVHIRAMEYGAQIAQRVYSIGRDIIQGIVEGIKAAPGAVWDALQRVIGFGVDKAKEFLGINSPSLLFMEFGENITQGLAIGIDKGTELVADAFIELAEQSGEAGEKVSNNFERMSQSVLGSFRSLANGIQSGGFLGILDGVIGLFTSVANTGAFKGLGINPGGLPSADGGGFTGNGPRSGGMDGKGGFLAMLHPQETVIDHTRGMGGREIKITLDIGPNGNIIPFIDGRVAGLAPAIATAGATMAEGRTTQSARRRYR